MRVSNELAGGADEATHRDRTEIEVGQVEVRIALAEVGHVHPENLPRKLFPKGGDLSRSGSISVQKRSS